MNPSFASFKPHSDLELTSTDFGIYDTTAKRPKRMDRQSMTRSTSAPYDDGYQWRKYGEKKISKSKFSRSYYRCTYKEETNCPARKQVQQKDTNDPPLFSVTYFNSHTCDCDATHAFLAQPPTRTNSNILISFNSSDATKGKLPVVASTLSMHEQHEAARSWKKEAALPSQQASLSVASSADRQGNAAELVVGMPHGDLGFGFDVGNDGMMEPQELLFDDTNWSL